MKHVQIYFLFLIILIASCSKDNDDTPNSSACFKDNLTATSTKVDNAAGSNTVLLDFDVKNTSSSKYEATGINSVYFRFTVTCTDNSTYQTEQLLTATSVNAGATATAGQYATYGAGKTFKDVKYELFCK